MSRVLGKGVCLSAQGKVRVRGPPLFTVGRARLLLPLPTSRATFQRQSVNKRFKSGRSGLPATLVTPRLSARPAQQLRQLGDVGGVAQAPLAFNHSTRCAGLPVVIADDEAGVGPALDRALLQKKMC